MDTSDFDNAECHNPNHDLLQRDGAVLKICPLPNCGGIGERVGGTACCSNDCTLSGVLSVDQWQSFPRLSDETRKIAQELWGVACQAITPFAIKEALSPLVQRIESIGEVGECERCDHGPYDECDCKCHTSTLGSDVPSEVWVAEYFLPYRSVGTYTPHVYRDEPKELDEVKWVLVPVRTSPVSEEKPLLLICDGCRVNPPHEHKCHEAWPVVNGETMVGDKCECPDCHPSEEESPHINETETQAALNVPCMFCGEFPKAEKDGTLWCDDTCWGDVCPKFAPKKWIEKNGDSGWKVRELRRRQGDDVD